MKRLVGQRGLVFVAPGEVKRVTRNRKTWSRVWLKGGYRVLARGVPEVVSAALAGTADEVTPRRSTFRLVGEVGGVRGARDVAVEDIAALECATERGWCLVVLKGGETLCVVGDAAQILKTGASPREALKALGTLPARAA